MLRLLPILTAVILGMGFVLMRKVVESVVFVIPSVTLLLTILLYTVSAQRKTSHAELFRLLFPGVFFVITSGLFATILDHWASYYLFTVLASVLIAWYVLVCVQYLKRLETYQPPALEMLSITLNLLSLFFAFSWLFAFVVFFGTAIWKITIPGALIFGLFFIHSLWDVGADKGERWLLCGVLILLSVEALGVASFLPFGYFSLSVLLTLIVLFLHGLGRARLEGRSVQRAFRLYGGVLIIGTILTILTTRWTP